MRIVIVSEPKRKDFYNYIADQLKEAHELFLLWHYDKQDAISDSEMPGITYLYWKDYITTQQFLIKIKPERIIFFEIIDFWQIPLIISCHKFKVATFFVEHGVGNSVEQVIKRFDELPATGRMFRNYAKKLFFSANRILRNRIFYFSVLSYLKKKSITPYLKILIYYKKMTPIHALSKLKFRERTPHFAILFNRNNVAPFKLYNEISDNDIIIEGVPFFDKYFYLNKTEADHIVFIEHPYLEEGILDWTSGYHEKVARSLESFAIKNQIKLLIKLHPRSDINNWLRYQLNEDWIAIKQKEDVMDSLLAARIVLGYSSTLINVLICCKKNVVLLGWHPVPNIFGDDFSKSGLCHVSFDPDDLSYRFNEWSKNNLAQQNETAFQEFIKEYNYPFDGQATNRVINALINNAVS